MHKLTMRDIPPKKPTKKIISPNGRCGVTRSQANYNYKTGYFWQWKRRDDAHKLAGCLMSATGIVFVQKPTIFTNINHVSRTT